MRSTLRKAIVVTALVFTAALSTAAIPFEEDHPFWNCAIMGNHICGELVNGEWFNNHYDAHGEYLFTTPQNRKG